MPLETNLIFLIMFGIIGFITSKIWGINPYKMFSDVGAAVLIIIMLIIVFPSFINPEKSPETIENLMEFFVNNLPGIIIGDLAGSIVSAVTGD